MDMPSGLPAAAHAADFQAALAEAEELVQAAGGVLQATVSCRRAQPHAALFVGTGKAEELAAMVRAEQIDLVVFNHELSPTQERNLEKTLQCRVLDRIGLILAIFAQRAQTQEGRLQVELAQLTHLSSRLVRGYGHLQSQRGGIGLKGPGETQLETDRRLIGQKIARLKKRLAEVKRQRATQRKNRARNRIPVFALVGYTNVGKSTLFNRLTKADVLAKDQLFATLDTTARRLWLAEDVTVLLTDTVGFVRDLPHRLIAAFSATLEETAQADILLHVADAAHADVQNQIEHVNAVLREIGAGDVPQIIVYNKIDRLPEQTDAEILRNHLGDIEAVRLSATDGSTLNVLRTAIAETVRAFSATN
ncbi:MAG: GTPase HflX [Neisseria sp.]|nr:GTPase HflX [Neisseria sp.]